MEMHPLILLFKRQDHTLNGQGPSYWDGEGTNGGVTKPHPMVKITKGGGTFENLVVLNSPAQAVSVGNTAALTVTNVKVDNSAGTALGHNTDCFDTSGSDLTITESSCYNQDDCLAINSGSTITFSSNVGEIVLWRPRGKAVSDVKITGNTIEASVNALRIKTVYDATDASVTDVTYEGNTATGITQYGVVIEQDYENGSPTGTPSNGVTLGPVTFTGTNTITVASGAERSFSIDLEA
ncbi:hypothetical protein HWV62_3370 [Athelia sp. TMB]|nr:hypothetical protein HWV62_3370 [Athelia sp. TMB]